MNKFWARNLRSVIVFAALVALFSATGAAAAHRVEKDIVFDTHGGVKLLGDLYIPEGKGPFPAIMFYHGGGFVGGTKDYPQVLSILQFFADNGYVVFSANYRLLTEGGLFPNNTRDAKCALAWLKKNGAKYNVDTKRIATMGESAGAYMAVMMALTPNEDYFKPECDAAAGVDLSVQAGVIYYAPYDFHTIKAGFTQMLEIELKRALKLKTAAQVKDFKLKNSPVSYVSKDEPPLLLFHSDPDSIVQVEQAREMDGVLKNAGANYEMIIYKVKGIDHGFVLTNPNGTEAMDSKNRALAFLDKYLNGNGK